DGAWVVGGAGKAHCDGAAAVGRGAGADADGIGTGRGSVRARRVHLEVFRAPGADAAEGGLDAGDVRIGGIKLAAVDRVRAGRGQRAGGDVDDAPFAAGRADRD